MLPLHATVNDRYRIIYAVDERPGGHIYRARDEHSGRMVLVGALPFANDQERTDTELLARQLVTMHQEALLPLIDHFAVDQAYYLVSEDPGGQDLERVLRARGGPLAENEALGQARKLLDSLDALHKRRPPFFMGDLWMSDVWVAENGDWRVAPFTFARPIGSVSSPYRAPELASPNVEPDGATDTYAVSALLYHALTGWPPPTAEQQEAGTPLNGPRALNPALSTLVEQALLRGLQQRHQNRYQNAREMRLALETVQMMAGRSLGLGPDVLMSQVQPASDSPLVAPQPAADRRGGVSIYPTPDQPPEAAGAPGPAPQFGGYQPAPASYPVSAYPVPAQKRGGIGCLVAAVVLLALVVVGLGIVLLLLLLPGSPLRALLIGSAPSAPFATVVAPASSATGVPAEATAAPPAATSERQQSEPAVNLGPKAISLQNAGAITRTHEITTEVSGPISFSLDGKQVAIGINSLISLRDGESLRQERQMAGHHGQVGALMYAPDGKLLASGAVDDPQVRLWDPTSGQLVRTLDGHSGWIRSLAFSPDGKLLASAATDKTIRLWDPASGQLVRTLEGHSNWIGGIAFAPDGTSLASASRDGTVRLWDVASGREREGFAFQTPLNPETNTRVWATGVAFSSDGKQIAVGATDSIGRLIDATTGATLHELRGHNDWIVIRGLVFTPDSKTLLTASLDGTIRAWDTSNGVEVGRFEGHRLSLSGIALSSDGTHLISNSNEEGLLFVWDVAQRSQTGSLRIGQGLITTMAYTSDSSTLATVGYNGVLKIYDLSSERNQVLVGSAVAPQPMAFLPDNRLVTISDERGVVVLGRSDPMLLSGLDGNPLSVAASSDGRMIAAGSDSGSISLWDGSSGAAGKKLRGQISAVYALAFSSDGGLLAAAGSPTDTRIDIYDLTSGSLLKTLEGSLNGIGGMAFQPHSQLLAASDLTGALRIWDAQSGELLRTVEANQQQRRFVGLAYSPDGQLLAAGALDGEIIMWNATTGAETASLLIPEGGVLTLTFSPDGQQLAISIRSEDTPVYIYEVK